MISFTRKTLLALEAVVDIAYHGRPHPVQSKEISRRQGIPQRYLEHVMQHLVRAGVLNGVRGPKGGYALARERRRITVGEILRIVAELERRPEPEDAAALAPPGSTLARRVVRPLWAEAEARAMATFDAVTIEDLCRRAEAAGVVAERPVSAPPDDEFSI